MELTDWGIVLNTKRTIPEDTRYIGYRAHHFEPVWGDREDNCLRFDLARFDELPFEYNYYIRPETTGGTDSDEKLIYWFVQGEEQEQLVKKGMPNYLRLNEEGILFLK